MCGHLRFALNKLSFKIGSGWSYKDDFTVISIYLAAGAGDAPADHWAERLREVQLVPNPQRPMASLPGNPAQTPNLIHVLHSTKVIYVQSAMNSDHTWDELSRMITMQQELFHG